jgi:hypothetical protein
MFEAPLTVRVGELEFAVTSSGTMTKVEVTRVGLRKDDAVTRMTGDAKTQQAKAALKAILAFIS